MGIEPLEARNLMAALNQISVTAPLSAITGGMTVQEQAIQLAFEQASNLSRYSDAQLQATTQWVLQVGENVNVTQLAQQLGVASLVVQPLIPDTYTYTLPLGANPLTIGPALQATSGVIHAYPLVDKDLDKYFVPNDPLYPAQWHLNNTGQTGGLVGGDANVEGAWDITRGQNVVIAVIDEGTEYTHPDLAAKYQPQWSKDIVDNDLDPSPGPGEGHGTAVAGIAVASTNNGIGVAGAAPDAQLAAIRMLGGPLTDAELASAFNFFNQELDILNNSWGSGGEGAYRPISPLTLAAMQQAAATGRGGLGNVIVFAAGNGLQEDDNANYKGEQNQPYVIAVANINHLGRQSLSSEPGDNILVAAWSATPLPEPGVVTTDVTGSGGYNTVPDASDFDPIPDLAYTSLMSGTSAAAPLVSGVVALMLSANPSLSWRDVKHILVRTAVKNDITDSDWSVNGAGFLVSHKYGYGAIDAEAAVRMAQTWTNVAAEVVSTTGGIPVNLPLPDNSPAPTGVNITVPNSQTIETVTATIDITHLYPEDVEIVLISPSGTRSILATPRITPYASTMQGGYTFSSTHFWGEQTAGVWRLEVRDGIAQDVGVLNAVQLNFYGTLNPVPTIGTISGVVWDDLNFNGARDLGENGIAGATVYIDANGNGVPDVGERSAVTVANGGYTFNNLSAGAYTIDLVVPGSYTQTFPASGVGQVVNLAGGQVVTNLHFGMTITPVGPVVPPPPPPPAIIGGTVFNDLDGDGLQGPGEHGIPNVIVYVDSNNDNSIGFGELAQTTNIHGQFSFAIRAGTYTIRQANLPGWETTAPGSGFYTVTGASGEQVAPILFGNLASVDWGDAPTSFPTLASQSGASHGILSGMYLGSGVDGEGDGQPSLGADSDDNITSDDDDGVVFLTPLIAGQMATIDVTVHNGIRSAGMLNAWIDFNGDNDWDDPGERIITSGRVVEGVNRLSFLVPAYALPGNAYARFRYGYGANVSYAGHVLGGEVEDYVAKIIGPVPVAKPDQFTVQKNSVANVLDVLFNDAASTQGSIKILATSMGSLGGTIQLNAITQKLVYTPPVNLVGVETFTYTISDSRGGIATTTVSVKIVESATPPRAVDDSIDILANSLGTTLPLLTNDILGSGSLAQLSIPNTSSVGGALVLLQPGNVVQYTPLPGFVGLDQFQYRIRDTNGLESTAVVTMHVGTDTGDDTAAIELEVTDSNGAPITEVVVGQSFQLRAFVRDMRPGAVSPGLIAAFFDVLYSAGLAAPVSAQNAFGMDVTFAAAFNSERSGALYAPGLINEIGASQSSFISTSGSTLLFRMNFTGTALGTATFRADPADTAIVHDVRFGNNGLNVALDKITFGQASIAVVSSLSVNFQNSANRYDVSGDGRVSPVDALLVINELNARGSFSVAGRTPQAMSTQGILTSMWDVDGDNFVGPTDAALIINRINSGAFGEAPATDALLVGASIEAVLPEVASEEPQDAELTVAWLPDLLSDDDWVEEIAVDVTPAETQFEQPVVAFLPYLFTDSQATDYSADGDSEGEEELESLLAVLADNAWQTI